MYNISLKQEQYLTYILSNQTTQSRLEVVPEKGGIITRWCLQGQEMLYMDTERFSYPQLSVRGGIPILFPICGNLPDNMFTYKSRQYTLKQHGFARDLPWEVTAQSAEQDLARITLDLTSNKETLAVYPFEFTLSFTYIFQGNKLTILQRYTNQSSESMPCSFGFHPYFWIKDKSKLEVQIPATEYRNKGSQQVHSFTGGFDFSTEEIDIAFSPLSGNVTSLVDSQRGLKLSMTYDDCYSTLVFWTLKGKDYVCLEPWSAPRNALNTGDNLTTIAPGDSYEASVEMNVSNF